MEIEFRKKQNKTEINSPKQMDLNEEFKTALEEGYRYGDIAMNNKGEVIHRIFHRI